MQSSLFSWYLVPTGPKYSPQDPLLESHHPIFLPHVRDQVSHPYETSKITVLYLLIFMILDSKSMTILHRTTVSIKTATLTLLAL